MTPFYTNGSKFAHWFATFSDGQLTRVIFPIVLITSGAVLEYKFGNNFFARFGSVTVAYSLFLLWVQLSLFSDREGIQSWFDSNFARGIRPTGAFESFERTGSLEGYEAEIVGAFQEFSKTAGGGEEWKMRAFLSYLQYMNEFSSRLPQQRRLERNLFSANIFWAFVGTFIWGFGDLLFILASKVFN